MPRVSVVIPAYNAEAYLAQAIESALAQTYRDLEVVVVNDGSTDGTGEIIERYAGRVRGIHQENRGLALARNRGITESDSEFVALLDADDTWRADKLRKQVLLAEDAGQKVGLVSSDCTVIDERGRPIGAFRRRPICGAPLQFLILYNPIIVSTALVRRECFQRLGLFSPEPTGCEDWHMWIRIASAYRFAHISEPLANYRSHTASMAHKPDLMCHGLRRALDLVFADPAVGPKVQHLRAKAYARAQLNCAIGYFRAGEMTQARAHLAAAARLNPAIVSETAFVATLLKTLLGRRASHCARTLKRALGRVLRGGM